MENKFNFTQSRIRAIQSPDKKGARDVYHDKGQPKLILRVSSTGNKSFAVVKKDSKGAFKRVTLGNFTDISVDDARNRAKDILSDLNKGVDPVEEKRLSRAKSQTLQELFDSYLQDHDLAPVTVTDYNRKMKWGFEGWLKKPASQITESMVLAKHKKLTKKGKTATNGAFRPLRAVFNYAITKKAISHNPVAVLSAGRLWHKERRRTDIIRPKQLGEWLNAVDQLEPAMHRVAFKMFLFMGFRVTETYKIEWSDVDLSSGLIVQRDTKNHTDHELPIPKILLPEIGVLKRDSEQQLKKGEELSPFMFPATKRDSFHGRPKLQIASLNKSLSFHFSPHMARHTFTTICEAVGIPKTMIDRLTNHTMTGDVTAGYIHTEVETLREAINKVADYIEDQIQANENEVDQKPESDNEESNVVQLRR